MKHVSISDHAGPVPSPRELAEEANDIGKREALEELRCAQSAVDYWQSRVNDAKGVVERYVNEAFLGDCCRRLANAKAALADAPGGESCKKR